MMAEFRVLGEGGFGCVLSPALPCDGQRTDEAMDDGYVSKIMTEERAEEEVQSYKSTRMRQYDPKHEFTVGGPIRMCNVRDSERDLIKTSCRAFRHGGEMRQIHYLNGGTELAELISNSTIENYRGNPDYYYLPHELFPLFVPLIKGIHVMNSRGYYHTDIKLQNILVRESILRLIDFGLATSMQELLKKPQVLAGLDVAYFVRPPEILFMSMKKYDHGAIEAKLAEYDTARRGWGAFRSPRLPESVFSPKKFHNAEAIKDFIKLPNEKKIRLYFSTIDVWGVSAAILAAVQTMRYVCLTMDDDDTYKQLVAVCLEGMNVNIFKRIDAGTFAIKFEDLMKRLGWM
jgi:serine/threonine protein kinase